MKKNTLIILVTLLIVVTVLGMCIGFLGHSLWKDIKLQQGEMVTNPDKLEVTYAGVHYEPSAHFEEGECYLVLNVTNRHNFSWARISIDVNYTDNGKERELSGVIHGLETNETKAMPLTWGSPFTKPEECKEGLFREWEVTEITAFKYKNGISVSAETAEEWDAKGNSFAVSGKYEKAIECFEKAIDLNPNFAEAYSNRGVTYCHLKQYERAIEDYDKAIELNPNFALAYSNRGFTYCCLKQYERAIEDCDKAIELDPNLAGAYTNRGNAYKDLDQYERAIEDYDKAIELDPNDAEAYDNRELASSKLKEQKATQSPTPEEKEVP